MLLGACLGVVVVRATYLLQPLRSDEGGYLLIARRWRAGGEFLYGDYYVDRPPLLMLIFRVAALSEWDRTIRLLTIPVVLLGVVAAWWAGRLLAGRPGGAWAAVTAAALLSSPAVGTDQADGGVFAAAFVMSAFALALAAWEAGPGRRVWFAFAAGVLAGAAPLVKQSFLEGLLFVGVLVVVSAFATRPGRRELALAGGAAAGGVVPYMTVWVWARSTGLSVQDLWRELVTFRGEVWGTIWAHDPHATLGRGAGLLLLGLVSGLFAMVVIWLASVSRRRGVAAPVEWGITAVLVYGAIAIVAGGSYWPHYLIQLVPGAVLAVGLLAPRRSSTGRRMRGSAMLAVGSAAVGALAVGAVHLVVPGASSQERTGEWLAASSAPGDRAFVAYGDAAILEAADLDSPYPHLWSLPMRTRDPDQDRLTETLSGTEAPAWVVGTLPINSWGIDADRSVRDVLGRRYRVVAQVCGHEVWLRRDLTRRLASPPPCWRP